MNFSVVIALVCGTAGALFAVWSLYPSAVALSALGVWLAFRARQRAKFMNESMRPATIAVALNLLSLAVGGLAVAQFGATFLWIWRSEAPQIYDFRTTFNSAIAPPTPPADLGTTRPAPPAPK